MSRYVVATTWLLTVIALPLPVACRDIVLIRSQTFNSLCHLCWHRTVAGANWGYLPLGQLL
jgi:hypothetical protein